MNPELSWLQKHERLLIILIAAFVLVYIGRGWLNKHYDLASQEVTSTAKTLINQQTVNQQLQDQYKILSDKTELLLQQLQTQNAQLAAQAASAYQQAANQQALDAKLSNQQLAGRIEQLANQKNVQSTDQGVTLNHDQSVGVTQQLEDVPMLKLQLQSEQSINDNNNKQIAGLTDQVNSCNTITTGLHLQLTDQKKADDAELKKAKISGIRGRLRWFGAGFVAGFITGHGY